MRARMFAPAMGIAEDPATGAGAAALGASVAMAGRAGARGRRIRIAQGVEMGRPSRIDVEVEGQGAGAVIRIAGEAVVMGEGRLRIGPG